MSAPIVLIDLSSIARPLYEAAIDVLSVHVDIVRSVRELSSGQKHVAICCDAGRSFRKDLDGSYKANRAETPATYLHQVRLAQETLRGDGFPVWSAEGFEADDLIATACAKTHDALDEHVLIISALIISADKDLLQLVSARVMQFRPGIGTAPAKTYDEAGVLEKFGVTPLQMLDYLALVGDSSDNIVGAKGIGPKTAAKLLTQFGNIDDMYTAVAGGLEVTPALMASLLEFAPRLPLVRELLTLRTDAPIPFEEVFRPRVPADVAVFSEDDIAIGMPTLETQDMETPDANSGSTAGCAAREQEDAQNSHPVDRPTAITADAATTVHPAQVERRVESLGTPVRIQPIAGQQALAVQPEMPAPTEWERQLEPRNIGEAKQLADWVFQSRLFSAYGHPAGVLTTVLAGRELGLQAMSALRAFHIVEGKATMAADFMRALVLRSGLVDYFRCTERTNERATFVIKRKNEPEVTLTYTMEEARVANLVKPKGSWERNAADMLVARASSKLARLVCPEITFGMYAPEEME